MPSDPDAVYDFGPYRLDPRQHQLFRDGAVVPLTPKAFDTLLLLVLRHGEVVSRQDLVARVWHGTFVEEGGLTRNISVLRKALAGDDADERHIETVPKRGYRFVAPVRVVVPPPPSATPVVVKSPRARLWVGAAILLAIGVAVAVAAWNRTPDAGVRSLAVLPFKAAAPVKAGEEYLGPAMADALITRLSRLEGLTLRPMRAVMEYDLSSEDPRGIGRKLQVEAVLDGRVHRDGERVHVTVELIRVGDGTILWTGQFTDRFTDLFARQDSIAQEVAVALAPRVGAAADVSLRARRPRQPEAYEVYLQGRYHWNKRTPESLERALMLFDRALAIDATYASAYAGLADAYSLMGAYAYQPSGNGDAFVRAAAAARRALEADDTLAEAHASLGFVRFGHEWDWEGAEREYRRAIDLDPNYATAHHWYAILLMVLGRADASIEAIRRAERIDPLSPAIGAEVATLLWMARRYDEGVEQIARVRRLHPALTSNLAAGELYLDMGKQREAIEEFRRVQQSNSSAMLPGFARARAAAGDTAEAERLLRRFDDGVAAGKLYANPFERAGVLAALGRRDEAFKELEEAYRNRFIAITWLKVAPSLDALRGDSRYVDLLRRLRLQ